jgi:hypothetical protein
VHRKRPARGVHDSLCGTKCISIPRKRKPMALFTLGFAFRVRV